MRRLFIKDWSLDPLTATTLDQAPLYHHPQYGLPPAMMDLFDRRLHFGSTETAHQYGGYLEGALEASETLFEKLQKLKTEEPAK